MVKTFVVFRSPGSRWMKGIPTREQPLWDEHAPFMDSLFDTGVILLGGPYTDHSGAMLIIQTEDETAVFGMLHDDPWETHDIQVTSSVREWLIFLDSREKPSG